MANVLAMMLLMHSMHMEYGIVTIAFTHVYCKIYY